MVAETRLDDGEFEVFMTAIGKDSVVAEKLEGFVQRRRLHAILGQELIEQDSKLIRAIRNSLRSDYALPGVPGSEVASYFAAWKAVPPAGPVPAAALAPLSVAANGNADDDGADDAAKAGDFDTIVVPAQEEGFQDTFLGENRWYQIRIRRECIPFIKFIAVYRKAPVSAITHLAPVKSIVPWPGSAKYVVNFAEPAKEIPPIPAVRGGKVMAPQAPRYALRARLFEAKSLDELWEP